MATVNPSLAVFSRNQDATITITMDDGPIDITGWTITATIRANMGTAALVTKTVGSGIELTTPASGIFTITLSAADLVLAPGAYVWSVIRTNSGYNYPIIDPSAFVVVEDSASAYPTLLSLSELKAILNLPTLTDDQAATYTYLMKSAELAVQRYCGRKFTYGTYTEYLDGPLTNVLQLREYPVTSITSINVDDGGYAGQATDPFPSTTLLTSGSDYYLDKSHSIDGTSVNGHVIRVGQPWGYRRHRPLGRLGTRLVPGQGNVKVVYIGGYSLVPYDLKVAISTMVNQAALSIPYGGMVLSESGEGYSKSVASPDVMEKYIGGVASTLRAYRSGTTYFG